MHNFNQYFDFMDVEPSCGYIANKDIQKIKIGFTAPVTPGSFSIGNNIWSEGKDANGQALPGLAFYNPQFINDNRVIILPIIPSSITENVTYRITLVSTSVSQMYVGGGGIIGKVWIEFTVRKQDAVPPYIVSMTPGLSAPLTRAEYLARPPEPIDATNVEPHSEVLVRFSEILNFTNVVSSREAPIGAIPGLNLISAPYINPSEEVNFVRADTTTQTILSSQTVKGLLPGFQYAFDFISCGSGCLVNCASGTQDLSGWYLVPCLGSECSDLKVDDTRSFTTSKVRIDAPQIDNMLKKYPTKGNRLNINGIITKDLSGSVNLDLEGTGVGTTTPVVVIAGSYNTYSTTLDITSVPEGNYKLKAIAPGGGGEDYIPIVIDRTSPVISKIEISPSYNQYVPQNFSVLGTVNDTGSGLKKVTVNGVSARVTGNRFSVNFNYSGFGSGTNITISAQAEDYAGNISTIATKNVVLDKEPPVLTNINISNTYYNSWSGKTYIRGYFTVSGNVSDLSGANSIKVNGFDATVSGNTFSAYVTGQSGTINVGIYAVDNVGNKTEFIAGGPYEVDNTAPVWPYFVWSSGIIEPGAFLTVCGNILFYWEWLIDLNIYGTKVRINWYEPDLNYTNITYAYEPQFTDPQGKVVYKMTICVSDVVLPEEIYAPGQNSLEFCTSDYVGNLNCNPFFHLLVFPTIESVSPNYGKPGDTITITGWGFKWFNSYSGQDYITINGVEVLPEYIISVTENTIQFRVPPNASSGELKVYVNNTASNSKLFTVCSNRDKFVKDNLYDGTGISMAVTPDGKPWISFKDDFGVYVSLPSPVPESGGWWTFPIYVIEAGKQIGQNTSIAIREDGKIIVCYTLGNKPASGYLIDSVGELRCWHNLAGSVFKTDVVDWDVRLLSVSVAINPITNLPGVVYSWGPAGALQPKELWYAWMDGNYVWHQVKMGGFSGYAFDLSLAIDSLMKPHVAFRFAVDYGYDITYYIGYATLKPGVYFPYVNADSWGFEWLPLNLKDGFRPTIKIGSDNIPRIVFHEGDFYSSTLVFMNKLFFGINNGVIKYAYKSGGVWYFEDVDYIGAYSRKVPISSIWTDEDIDKYLASQVIGMPLSFYLDSSNNPVISYYREDTKSLYLAKKNPITGAWEKQMIDAGVDTDSVAIDVSRSLKARVAYNNEYLATECQNVVKKTDLLYFQEENGNFIGAPTFGGQCYAERFKIKDFSKDEVMGYIKNNEANFDFSVLGGFGGGFDFNKVVISALLNQRVYLNNSILGIKNLTEYKNTVYDHCNKFECGLVGSEYTCWIPTPLSKVYFIDEILIDRRCNYDGNSECKDAPTNSILLIFNDYPPWDPYPHSTQINLDLTASNISYKSYFYGNSTNYYGNFESHVLREWQGECGGILGLWYSYVEISEDIKDDSQMNGSVVISKEEFTQKVLNLIQPTLNCTKPLPKFPINGTYIGIIPSTINSSYLEMGCSEANCNTGFEIDFVKEDFTPGLLKISVKIPLVYGDGLLDVFIGRIGAYTWLNDTYIDLYYLPSITSDGLNLKFYKAEFHCINYNESGCGQGEVYCSDIKSTMEEQFGQMRLIPEIFAKVIENYFRNFTPGFSESNDFIEAVIITSGNIRFYWRDNP